MKPDKPIDDLFDSWAEHRRGAFCARSSFTDAVMEKVRVDANRQNSAEFPKLEIPRPALLPICAVAGVGKVLLVVRFAL